MSSFSSIYKKHLKFGKPYKWAYIFSIIVTLLLLILNNIATFAVGNIIDQITQGNGAILPALLFIGLALASPLIAEPVTFHIKSRIFTLIVKDITSALYKKVLNLDYDFHTRKQTGKLISMVINADSTVGMFIWQTEWWVLEQLASLAIPLVLIAIIDFRISLIVIFILIISYPILSIILKDNVRRRNVFKETEYTRNSKIVDGISNYETVRIFGREKDEVKNLNLALDDCKRAANLYQNNFRYIDFTTRILGVIQFLIGSYVAVYLFEEKAISLGSMIVIISYLIQISGKIMSLVFSIRDILKNTPIAQDLYDLLDEPQSINDTGTKIINTPIKGRIEFENVIFGYEDGNNVLRNLSVSIKPMESVAFVGPSGGGKSTIVKLLLRYYDVNKGSIRIDNSDIRNVPLNHLKSFFGVVPQEPVLFNRSILYNIGYAISSDEKIIEENFMNIKEACKRAQIHDFISSLPLGYKTEVGERGIKLSGGQKQRIAIARVLLRSPQIVIFDEATSMLDSESEIAIQKAFRELSRDKTTIVIAHRLSTIMNSDKIFVIEQGKLVEQGTHKQLLSKKGLYAHLWKIQSGGFKKGT